MGLNVLVCLHVNSFLFNGNKMESNFSSAAQNSILIWPQTTSYWYVSILVGGDSHVTCKDEDLCMHHQTFDFICGRLGPLLSRRDTFLSSAIQLEKSVAVTIWHLATDFILTDTVVVRGSKTHFTVHLWSMWSQCAPDHSQEGQLHSVNHFCFYGCTIFPAHYLQQDISHCAAVPSNGPITTICFSSPATQAYSVSKTGGGREICHMKKKSKQK